MDDEITVRSSSFYYHTANSRASPIQAIFGSFGITRIFETYQTCKHAPLEYMTLNFI